MALPREYVDGPSYTPLPYGLLDALASEIRTPADRHWEGGVTYETLCGAGSSTYDECFAVSGTGTVVTPQPPLAQTALTIAAQRCEQTDPTTEKAATTEFITRGATSFTVYAEVDCSAVGFWDRSEQYAEEALQQSEQYEVEKAIWTGFAGGGQIVFPHLAADVDVVDDNGYVLQTAAETVTGGVVLDVVEALGRLESALTACYNGVGIIHAPRILTSTFHNAQLIVPDGPRYRTANGNIVVFGSGYTGSSPSGDTSDTQAWMYATGMLFIYKGPAHVFASTTTLDRATNTVHALAERTYVVGWNCCHIGANVTLGGVAAGAAGTPGAFA